MEVEASSPRSSLGHRLRARVCCCFGGGLGDWGAQWRRGRAGVGEFRYDPLSYALNFDEGADDGDYDDDSGLDDGALIARSPSPPPRTRTTATTTTTAAWTPVAVAVA